MCNESCKPVDSNNKDSKSSNPKGALSTHYTPKCFTPFTSDISALNVPKKFTFPFCYQPSDLAIAASKQLQQRLLANPALRPNLEGAEQGAMSERTMPEGKMFGVLVVKNSNGELGFLSAYSGKPNNINLGVVAGAENPKENSANSINFVPPVFDPYSKDSFYFEGQLTVNQMNADLASLIEDPKYLTLIAQREQLSNAFNNKEQQQRAIIIAGRKARKLKRQQLEGSTQAEQALAELAKESVFQKNQLLAIKAEFSDLVTVINDEIAAFESKIEQLKHARKTLSNQLQQQLFAHYQFLNITHQSKDLKSVFSAVTDLVPPSGSGDCAAPKLLQYAFKNDLVPITMAEFWWGQAPKSEIRQHLNYYPACQGKCFPILTHMLSGMALDDNPLITSAAQDKEIEIVYQDDAIVIINKPAGLLSVPGKQISDSVLNRMKTMFPQATGGIIVHRLDMATSGLMVIALTARAHKQLQKQFIECSVTKYYVAVVQGILSLEKGEITLPLRGDFYDRPRQLVCFEHGKPAHTFFERLSIDEKSQTTRLKLFPKTGRTHQLRVHCAHEQGLQMPIIGDDLYGTAAKRLHLHAEQLTLSHPYTREQMSFTVEPNF